jgi:hypothetical protein
MRQQSSYLCQCRRPTPPPARHGRRPTPAARPICRLLCRIRTGPQVSLPIVVRLTARAMLTAQDLPTGCSSRLKVRVSITLLRRASSYSRDARGNVSTMLVLRSVNISILSNTVSRPALLDRRWSTITVLSPALAVLGLTLAGLLYTPTSLCHDLALSTARSLSNWTSGGSRLCPLRKPLLVAVEGPVRVGFIEPLA